MGFVVGYFLELDFVVSCSGSFLEFAEFYSQDGFLLGCGCCLSQEIRAISAARFLMFLRWLLLVCMLRWFRVLCGVALAMLCSDSIIGCSSVLLVISSLDLVLK